MSFLCTEDSLAQAVALCQRGKYVRGNLPEVLGASVYLSGGSECRTNIQKSLGTDMLYELTQQLL